MSQSNQIDILIKIQEEIRGLKRTVEGMDDLGREINSTTRETKDLNTQWNSFGHALKQGFGIAAMQATLRVASQMPGAFLDMTGAAADAAESASKLQAVFGQSTAEMNRWLAEQREIIPATTAEMQGYASGIQDLLVPLGVALNATTVKAKAFEQGIGDGKRELTAAERAQVSYQLILEGTTAAHGNAAETAGSAANQNKFLNKELAELAATTGEAFLPVLKPTVAALTAAARAAGELPTPIKGVGVAMVGATGAAVSLGLALKTMGIGLSGVGLNSTKAAAGITRVGTTAKLATPSIAGMAGATKALTAATGKLLLAAAALKVGWEIGEKIDEATGASDELAEVWTNLFSKADLSGPLNQTLTNLREQAREMDTLQEKEELREKTVQFRIHAAGKMMEARRNGEEAVAAQYQAQNDALGRLLGSLDQVLQLNQERSGTADKAAAAEAEITGELSRQEKIKRLLAGLDEEGLATRAEIAAELRREKALYDARISGDEKDIAKAEDAIAIERERQKLLRSGGVTDGEALFAAEQLVKLQHEATAAEKKRREEARLAREEARLAPYGNTDLRTRLDLLDQVQQKEQQTKQLRDGVRAEQFTDIDGRQKTRYFEDGRLLGDSDDFGEVGDPVVSPQPSPTGNAKAQFARADRNNTPAPQAAESSTGAAPVSQQPSQTPAQGTPSSGSAPDLTPITEALGKVNIDTSPVAIAVANLTARLQQQQDELASQIKQLAN